MKTVCGWEAQSAAELCICNTFLPK